MKKILLYVTAVGCLVWQSGCYYDKEEELYPISQCDTTNVTWNNGIRDLIQLECSTSGCHVGGGLGNGVFDSYAAVKAKYDNGSLRERVLVQKNMPPDEPLSDCQLSRMEAWINNGAPEN